MARTRGVRRLRAAAILLGCAAVTLLTAVPSIAAGGAAATYPTRNRCSAGRRPTTRR